MKNYIFITNNLHEEHDVTENSVIELTLSDGRLLTARSLTPDEMIVTSETLKELGVDHFQVDEKQIRTHPVIVSNLSSLEKEDED